MTRAALLAAAMCAALATATAVAAPALGPGATLRQKNEALVALLRDGGDAKQKEARALAATLIDYGAFARASLGEHWGSIKRRDELVAAFRQMLESRYLGELRARLDFPVVYAQEEIDGADASVTTVVHLRDKRRDAEEEIVYKLHKGSDGAWRVHDIVSDEISLVRNYKTQFHKIIVEQGAERLLEKIKAKL